MKNKLIENYKFGVIKIQGRIYNNDLLLIGTKIIPNWRRDEGHLLKKQDLDEIIKYGPNLLIIGKGYYGNMILSQDLENNLNFEIEKYKSSKAVKVYNEKISQNIRLTGAFHLTC
jgi:hypothetical protein